MVENGESVRVITIPASKALSEVQHPRVLRVAAYCRVSTDEERQLDSFENQVAHFLRLIESNENYELAGIYRDEGISGTSIHHREGFNSMIADCEDGKIDLVVTKSISRFARNTQDSLAYTRLLKDRGIGVIFEKEGINTLESSGELMLTLFSCFAQEESRSISENTAWGIRSRMRQGIPHLNVKVLLGYDKNVDGKLVIDESQACVVRRVYRMYLEGWSLGAIARTLNDDEVPGVHGGVRWCATTITSILTNEKYKGDLRMQKTFTVSYLTKHQARNTGQLDQYYVTDSHPAIIEPEMWEAVQQERERRRMFRERHSIRGLSGDAQGSAFHARVFCRECGSVLHRVRNRGSWDARWTCPRCGFKVEDERLRAAFCEAFNAVVRELDSRAVRWRELARSGTELERMQAQLMEDIVRGGAIPYEVRELTQAVLEEVWFERQSLRFDFLTGDEVCAHL